MIRTVAAIAVASFGVAACSNIQSATSQGPSPSPDVSRAYADLQASGNLVRASRNDMSGRVLDVGASSTPHTIAYVLADASSGEALYVLTTGADPASYIMVPMSLVHASRSADLTTSAGPQELAELPHLSRTTVDERFPVGKVTPVAMSDTPLVPGPSVVKVYRGSVVGLSAVDANGQPAGIVADAATGLAGDITRLVLTGPIYGTGSAIIVPAEAARLSGDRVKIARTQQELIAQRRYFPTDLPEPLTIQSAEQP